MTEKFRGTKQEQIHAFLFGGAKRAVVRKVSSAPFWCERILSFGLLVLEKPFLWNSSVVRGKVVRGYDGLKRSISLTNGGIVLVDVDK